MTPSQLERRELTLTLTGLQFEALQAWSDVTDPEPCFDHEDGEHGDFNECMGYAPEFQEALWTGYDALIAGWAAGRRLPKKRKG